MNGLKEKDNSLEEKNDSLKSYYLPISLTIALGMSVTLIRGVMPMSSY
jgi:hypothetical protein